MHLSVEGAGEIDKRINDKDQQDDQDAGYCSGSPVKGEVPHDAAIEEPCNQERWYYEKTDGLGGLKKFKQPYGLGVINIQSLQHQ